MAVEKWTSDCSQSAGVQHPGLEPGLSYAASIQTPAKAIHAASCCIYVHKCVCRGFGEYMREWEKRTDAEIGKKGRFMEVGGKGGKQKRKREAETQRERA